MKQKNITIYSIIISSIFLFTVIFFIVNIIFEYGRGTKKAEQIFENLADSIQNLGEQANIIDVNAFSSLMLYKNQNLTFMYPDERAMYAEDTKMVNVYRREIVKSENEKYILSAALYVLSPAVIFQYAKFSFIIISTVTFLTGVLLVFIEITGETVSEKKLENDDSSSKIEISENQFNYENKTSYEPNEKEQNTIQDSISSDSLKNDESVNKIYKKQETEQNQQEESKDIPDEIGNEDEISTDFETSKYEEPQEAININDYAFSEEAVTAEKVLPEDSEDNSILSPITGFCWEQNFKERLENEIIQAASSESDISLFIIKIPDISFTDTAACEICNYLLREFLVKELIFEYKKDGFAIIKPDMSIDEAEDAADKIQDEITNIISDTEKKCYIGISSRATRILSAERLIMEADEALKHSMEDDNQPITGFHVDIEKYKEFIKNN